VCVSLCLAQQQQQWGGRSKGGVGGEQSLHLPSLFLFLSPSSAALYRYACAAGVVCVCAGIYVLIEFSAQRVAQKRRKPVEFHALNYN